MKRNLSLTKRTCCIQIILFAIVCSALAADFPTKPITLICPYPPGGSMDLTARIIAKDIGPVLKQPVVVENRTGSAGVIGYTAAVKSPPDGYTITIIATPILFHSHAIQGVAYTPESFAPIAHLNYEPNALVVKTGSKLDMSPEKLFAYVKQHPDEVTIGVGGRWASQHMATNLLELATGMRFRKVFFTGGGPVITNVLGGHVDLGFSYYTEFFMHTPQGTLKAVAVGSEKKYPFLSTTPTFRELGMDVIAGTWRGLAAPAGTPEAVLEKIESACREVLKKPEVIEEFRKVTIEPLFMDKKAFAQLISADNKKYKPVVDKAKETQQ